MNTRIPSIRLFCGGLALFISLDSWSASYEHKASLSAVGGAVSAGVYQSVIAVGQPVSAGAQRSNRYTNGSGYAYYQLLNPMSQSQSVQVAEDTRVDINLGNNQLDGFRLAYNIASYPSRGQLSGVPPALSYQPNDDYAGSDLFSYTVSGGGATSTVGVISLSINGVNDRPSALVLDLVTFEDLAVGGRLQGVDPDGDTLSYQILTPPEHGVLTGSLPDFVYTPEVHYSGTDTFTYQVSDGVGVSDSAEVRLQVKSVNDAPVAKSGSVQTQEDLAVSLELGAEDADGDALSYTLVDAPSKGILSGDGASRVYTPNANFYGSDQFTFRVSDGVLSSSLAVVQISVMGVNDAPVAELVSASGPEDVPVSVLLSGRDEEGATLTYQIVQAPQNGVLSGQGAQRTYTPKANFNGVDSFTYTVFDGVLLSDPAT
ncbi:MAG: tandem-95 repeat protein, partial [Verrucomicrobia bacterium]|nr:tandem-95 repeat protein [Verrucomicrobiota bacterium]